MKKRREKTHRDEKVWEGHIAPETSRSAQWQDSLDKAVVIDCANKLTLCKAVERASCQVRTVLGYSRRDPRRSIS